MFRCQSGPQLAARSPLKPLRPIAAAACATLCAALLPQVALFAADAQARVPQPRQASALRPDPLNPQASVSPLLHESAFTQYRRLTDAPIGSWRDANDTVTRIGGWRVYAREAAQPAAPAAPVAASVAASASAPGTKPAEPAKAGPLPGGQNPHGGHKMN